MTQSSYGNGVVSELDYRSDNLLRRIRTPQVSGANQRVGNYVYDYDANKNKTSETISNSPIVQTGFGANVATAYDDQDRLTAWARNDGNFTRQWDLSLVGDWDGLTENGVLTNRTYSDAHEVSSIGASTLSHDAKGNLTQTGDGRTLVWDFDNRLSRVTVDAGSPRGTAGTHRYTYDAMGRRVTKVTGGQETVFVCAGPRVICEYTHPVGAAVDVNTSSQRYVHGSYVDELVLKENSDGVLYYSRNQQYSVVALTDAIGSVVERYSYTAYGKTTIHARNGNERDASQHDNDYTYTGRRSDPETGLIYFRARYYDADIGEFISRDPLGYVDGMTPLCQHT